MTRSRISSTSTSIRVALSLVALGLAACSMSFKAGGEAGKPAVDGDSSATPTKPTTKPIPGAEAEPEPTPAAEPDAPAEEATPTAEPPPVVEPKLTAVCRVQDPALEALCHRVLDPIAADDLEAWSGQLAEEVVVTRPTYRKGLQRLEGPQSVRDQAARLGGLRAMLHLRATDRLVGTLTNDCRQCRRTAVTFEANVRSGTLTIEVEMTQPPRIAALVVDANLRRPRPVSTPAEPTKLVPPAEAQPKPVVVPEREREPVELAPAEPKAPAPDDGAGTTIVPPAKKKVTVAPAKKKEAVAPAKKGEP